MMTETNRKMSVSYYDPSLADSDRTDVSFELTEGAESVLFSSFHDILGNTMRDGGFPTQKLHLFYRMSEQRNAFPPWIESEDPVRTYDLVLTEHDYHILSTVVGNALKNILRPDAADKYLELVDTWTAITEQMIGGGFDV